MWQMSLGWMQKVKIDYKFVQPLSKKGDFTEETKAEIKKGSPFSLLFAKNIFYSNYSYYLLTINY